jgi:hypothetical protein
LLSYENFEAHLAENPVQPTEWIRQEFSSVDLGDKRLNQRLIRTCEQLAASPSAPIPQACSGWASTKGAYRLFDNNSIELGQIIKPHITSTFERVSQHKIVLSIQDTVFFTYNHPSAQGIGPIGKGGTNDGDGLIMHHALALTPNGLPLGILHQNIWARDPVIEEAKDVKAQRLRQTPAEEKESWKWIAALTETQEHCPNGTKLVTIADRECDYFEFLDVAKEKEAAYVIRAKHDRKLSNDDETGFTNISEAVSRSEVAGKYKIEVIGNSKRAPRVAEVEVRFCTVTIDRPRSAIPTNANSFDPLTVHVISVTEVNGPTGTEHISWVLLTSENVRTFEAAQEKISWYCLRWTIEIYHKIMKSGCKVEERYLQTADRLQRSLELFSVIASRLLYMTYVARVSPDAPCTEVFADEEWQTIICLAQNTAKMPTVPPTMKDITRLMGRLGGFLGRKGDGDPGPIVLWRGLTAMMTGVRVWRTLHPLCKNE